MESIVKNCAIYTRKSTDEGLDTDFNTLDAQRESCEAYIASQRSEGWKAIHAHYNDGGFSGGNMERPGLQKLLADIKEGKIQIVVVYKIDRLTRSLMDFSKLVDVFDEHGVTFVSVTQSFNTTTSMGRLTLNVLLSFAQFEREVSAERIRDKIAASKKKGMWMGGNVPLGYDVEARKLIINKEDANTLRFIFESYLELGCVSKLKAMLDDKQIYTKVRFSKRGKKIGGKLYSRGALYALLKNPIYIGKIRHQDEMYDGLHEAIIEQEMWDDVQAHLQGQAPKKRGYKKAQDLNILKGLLFDSEGHGYMPTYTSKAGKRYRYYINQNLASHPSTVIARLPAHDIEEVVKESVKNNIVQALCLDPIEHHGIIETIEESSFGHDIPEVINRIIVDEKELSIELNCLALKDKIEASLGFKIPLTPMSIAYHFSVPFHTRRSHKGAVVIKAEGKDYDPLDLSSAELKNLVCGVIWRDRHFAGDSMRQIARDENMSEAGVRKTIMRSFDTLMSL